ncbi:MAG: macro domain-containing protein [Armatimonadetes bacterium]|nr:macro domain-containing protein [Armatimonadota bacterium]
MNLQALLPQLPFLLVTLFAFVAYGTMVRREILTGAKIWQGGVVIGLIAVALSLLNDQLNIRFPEGTPISAYLMNPGVMVFCTVYCVFFAYRLQKVTDVAAWTVGDGRIQLRVSPVSKITDADALIVPTGTRLEMRHGVPGQIHNAGGDAIADAAKSFAPVGLGKIIVTPPGTLAAKKLYHVAVYEGGKPIKLDVLKRFVAQALIAARKDGAETVVIPLGAYPGLTVESASKALAETAQKQSKGIREIVLCVLEGRDEREATLAVRSVLGAPTPVAPEGSGAAKVVAG